MPRWNIRVYGLWRHQGRILVCEEPFQGTQITKFPGGGLEFGEGPEDCLVRELHEELGQQPTLQGHVYTTGFHIRSLRDENEQLLSIYYAFSLPDPDAVPSLVRANDSTIKADIQFRWLPLQGLDPAVFPLPGDRHVAQRFLTKP